MVHQYDHRHSSYNYPTSSFSVVDGVTNNKNYQQQQQQQQQQKSRKNSSVSSSSSGNNNNNNNNSSSTSSSSSSPTSSNAVNDNDTFVRFWPQSANNGAGSSGITSALVPPSCHPCGQTPSISSGANGNNAAAHASVENDVRWSKLLRHDGTPTKVLLYPEEGWARTATNAYWLLSIPWWNRNRCKVVEVAGTRRSTTQAKLIDAGRGLVYVVGSFKSTSSSSSSSSSSSDVEPEFKLALTSHISPADVNLGYLMTGTLERGRHGDSLQPTHFAVLRKFEFNH